MMATPASTQDAIDILAKLVGFDTTSAVSNLELIAYARDYLEGHGIPSTLVPNEDGKKACLFATIGAGEGGVGLSGHSDCVPVTGQSWTSDPFTLTERDGKLYGRGTCDMKGFIACVLASVPMFKSTTLAEPIHILVSYDEEVGCQGVRPMIARLGQDLPRPRVVIIGEPTSMQVIDGHKCIDVYRTSVTGKEAHSCKPANGVNAISVTSKLVTEIDRMADEVAQTENDPHFDPPYSTVMVGMVQGGTAPNIVPRNCEVVWQLRGLPGTKAKDAPARLAAFVEKSLLPEMRSVAPGAAIETKIKTSVPAFASSPDSDAVALAMSLTGANRTSGVSYATEAGLFQQAGCPAVVCGPGDIAQAHAADEFVPIAQIEACLKFLAKLAERIGP
ncbi:MAG: acetylornithine deacetylase [Methyloceanibacter sp.]|uniref:acetylornithine deacetylase n=1 Tax=Methyloceanibacter sp. TaxID=1965321 RepID=UPI001DA7054C|nr:acetylornithine deacetylase [Methyloceanibacter sp.]MCB1442450.1 acetylornithine deacetylase [Methyloceanibacter sp.]MCC0058979.1 acetylornithine deacetylase [Hyphomicrobiaceae bacterium]